MTVHVCSATPAHFAAWIDLAREVEPLFGPMADEPAFRDGLATAIEQGHALVAEREGALVGGVVVDPPSGWILWLAVTTGARGLGAGARLVQAALDRLGSTVVVRVQTFASADGAGAAARAVYRRNGFVEEGPAEPAPSGIPTVILVRPAG